MGPITVAPTSDVADLERRDASAVGSELGHRGRIEDNVGAVRVVLDANTVVELAPNR